jgi:hypothetical protein
MIAASLPESEAVVKLLILREAYIDEKSMLQFPSQYEPPLTQEI